jgi:hypothetical protein
MRKLPIILSLCMLMHIVFVSCTTQELDNLAPDTATFATASASSTNSASITVGGYTFSGFQSTDGLTWTTTINGQGAPHDISHVLISFNDVCEGDLSTLQAVSASIDNRALKIEYSVGNTGCSTPGSTFFKAEGFPDGTKNTTTTFTFTLNQPMGVNEFGIWVKAGNACHNDIVAGPGCTTEESTENCSMSQGYYFASPVSVWSSVTVGGVTMTKEEASAIFKGSKKTAAQKAWFQAATIKLSASTIAPTASIWTYVTQVESLITTHGISSNNKAFNAPAGAIGDWIDANHCED